MIGNKRLGYKVLNIPNPIECRIVNRLNRFVVKVQCQEHYYQAYINNTGRLYQFLIRGRKGFCVHREKPSKTSHQLFSIKEANLGAIVDTQLQMKAFEKALELEVIPWLEGYRILKRNARLGNSLIDYLLQGDGEMVYLEVKSAVLREGHHAMYPDCPSERGRKHIKELRRHLKQGGKATILFIAALPGVSAFKPNRTADPELCELLLEAHQAGVKIKSIGMAYHPQDSFIHLFNADLDINLFD